MDQFQKCPKTVYLAIQRKEEIEKIREIIGANYNNPTIILVKTPEIFQSLTGLLNLIEKHQNDGLVCVNVKEFCLKAIQIATKRGFPYIALMRNIQTGDWSSFCHNQQKTKTKRRRWYNHRRGLVSV